MKKRITTKNTISKKLATSNSKETIIISLGGSLIVPDQIDVEFIKSFRSIIEKRLSTKRFVLITGGGKTCRNYQASARSIGETVSVDMDWIGIYSTKLNGYLIRSVFSKYAHPGVIDDPTAKIEFTEDILIAAGWKPYCSSDTDAVLLAKNLGVKTIINLSNIDYVYTADPKKDKNAKKIEKINWVNFRKIVGDKWDPGLNAPFDPIASKLAQELDLKVVIMNGKNISNIEKFLDGKSFIGTVIEK